MNNVLQQKLEKIQKLIDKGATAGERKAAQAAFDKIIEKYNISDDELLELSTTELVLPYNKNYEIELILAIIKTFMPDEYNELDIYRNSSTQRTSTRVPKIDSITITAAYEYFRRHLSKQLNVQVHKVYREVIKRQIGDVKTRQAHKKRLINNFVTMYLIESNLLSFDDVEMVERAVPSVIAEAARNFDIEGGTYHTQIDNDTKQLGPANV